MLIVHDIPWSCRSDYVSPRVGESLNSKRWKMFDMLVLVESHSQFVIPSDALKLWGAPPQVPNRHHALSSWVPSCQGAPVNSGCRPSTNMPFSSISHFSIYDIRSIVKKHPDSQRPGEPHGAVDLANLFSTDPHEARAPNEPPATRSVPLRRSERSWHRVPGT